MTNLLNNRTMAQAADTGKSVHLSASAGSGKTRALKERYLALLDALDRRGLTIDQAVAITFTDKAAAEITERVMRDLPEAMLKKIIRGRQDLRISTIHSFCMNLLKRYPLEAGLPPDFGVLDSRDQANKIQKAVEDTLEEADEDTTAPLGGFTVDELMAKMEYLLSIRSRLKRMEIDAGGPEGLLASIRSGMELDAAEAELATLVTGTDWRISFARMERLLVSQGDQYAACMGPGHLALATADNADSAFKTAKSLLSVYFTLEGAPRKNAKITARSFQGDRRREYETLFFDIQALLYRLGNAYQRSRAGRESISLLRLYLRAEELYRQLKIREGLLDFDDLEICAYRLLQSMDSADILYWLDRKILHFLVDEFQDTSDIQWAILDKLTAELFAGLGADKRIPPTLFVVGDEKQSIYRFREANYRLIAGVREKMNTLLAPEAREVLTLDKNFRSAPEVVDTVNKVFTGLWGEAYKPSEADRTGQKGGVMLIELAPASTEGALSGPTEAVVLARELKSLIEGGAAIYKKNTGEMKPGGAAWNEEEAGYDDCAVLIQSRTRLKDYEAALQAEGIPYRVIGGIGFYEEEEIQAILNVLFHLWNEDDTFSLAAALKSPLFGLNDKDLFDLAQGGGLIDSLRTQHPAAAELLRHWRRSAGLVPLSKLIHDIVGDTGAYVLFGRRGGQAIFNIDKLLDSARDFDRRGYTTLQDFVEWVKNIRRTEQREATADMNLPGFRGAVSILTVHKAKGLEYPIVFLPGMNQTPRSLTNGPAALISETDGVKRMAVKDGENPVYEDLWKGEHGEQGELIREHQRLLYVAMTRARDRLIMLGTLGNNKTPVRQNTWLDYLHRTIVPERDGGGGSGPRIVKYAYPDWTSRDLPEEARTPARKTGIVQAGNPVDVRTVIDNLAPIPRSDAPEWKRATDFIEHPRETVDGPLPSGDGGAVSALIRGSVLHRCLEHLTTEGTYDLEQVVLEFPEIQNLDPERQKTFKDATSSVLKAVTTNEELAWVFERRAGAYSELPFLYQKGRSLISGIIDRVIVKDGEGFVIDYKAIRIENGKARESWKDHYRPQVRIYCEAVKELFGLAGVSGYLLFLDSSRLESVVLSPSRSASQERTENAADDFPTDR